MRTLVLYRVSLLSAALLDPAELRERQLGGDGGGQRQLVVGASCSLQFQTWKSSVDDDVSANGAGLMERMQMEETPSLKRFVSYVLFAGCVSGS